MTGFTVGALVSGGGPEWIRVVGVEGCEEDEGLDWVSGGEMIMGTGCSLVVRLGRGSSSMLSSPKSPSHSSAVSLTFFPLQLNVNINISGICRW